MNRCPGCGYIVPAAWTECHKCGAPLDGSAPAQPIRAAQPIPATQPGVPVAVPVPSAPSRNGPAIPPPPPSVPFGAAPPAKSASGFGAPDDALIAGARPRAMTPDTMLPAVDPLAVHAAASAPSRWNAKTNVIAVLAAACVIAGVYSFIPSGKHAKPTPVVLAARPPFAGIPTSLSDVVRIAAESARHTALAAVIDAAGPSGAALSLTQLSSAQPDYQWVDGSQPSTTNTVVSITSGAGIDVLAVSGTDHDICAYGRWSPTLGSEYVTMEHVSTCAATTAPTSGWSQLPGGSNQDLPNVDGS
jgi:hypothetical protein